MLGRVEGKPCTAAAPNSSRAHAHGHVYIQTAGAAVLCLSVVFEWCLEAFLFSFAVCRRAGNVPFAAAVSNTSRALAHIHSYTQTISAGSVVFEGCFRVVV